MLNISKEQLEKLFIIQNLSREICAKILNTNTNTIKRLCKYYNLKKSTKAKSLLRKQTCLERYGVEHISQTPEFVKKYKQTCIQKYGVDNVAKSKEIQEKAKQTCKKRYQGNSPMSSFNLKNKMIQSVKTTYATGIPQEKAKQTNLRKYNCERPAQNSIIKDKISKSNKIVASTGIPAIKRKQTCLERYGVEHISQTPEFVKKCNKTKRFNNSFRISKPEEQAYQLLLTKFDKDDIIRQYRSELYPFNCDFYIKSLDLYIEYQGSHYHYKEPYDENNIEHQKRLQKIEEKKILSFRKQKTQYERMLKVWTIEDPKKREIVKKNNLNFKEFFTINEFETYFNNYI